MWRWHVTIRAARSHHSPAYRLSCVVALALLALSANAAFAGSAGATQGVAVSEQAAFHPTARIEDDDPNAAFEGGWRFASTTAASGGTRRLATAPGASVKIRFNGTGVALISRVTPGAGRVAISVDGAPSTVVDLRGATVSERARVWTASGLPRRTHSVTVRALDTSPAARWQPAAVDAFLIEGTALRASVSRPRARVEESDRRIRFLGSWTNRASAAGASSGRAAVASRAGARAVVSFSGTGITWLAPNQARGARAQIVLDGRSYGRVSLSRSGSRGARRVMWSIGGLRHGRHTLDIRALSAPSAKSKVVLDLFELEGRAADARPVSSLGHPWRNYVVIDKSDFRLYLVKNGLVERTYPVAHGKVGGSTPPAVWRIGMKYPHTGGVYGPRKMRLFRQRGGRYVFTRYGIHGTNEPWVIGTRASRGCIRLYNDDVIDLFPRVPLGTMVVTRD